MIKGINSFSFSEGCFNVKNSPTNFHKEQALIHFFVFLKMHGYARIWIIELSLPMSLAACFFRYRKAKRECGRKCEAFGDIFHSLSSSSKRWCYTFLRCCDHAWLACLWCQYYRLFLQQDLLNTLISWHPVALQSMAFR